MSEALILKNVFSSFLSFRPTKGELLTVAYNKDEEITHKYEEKKRGNVYNPFMGYPLYCFIIYLYYSAHFQTLYFWVIVYSLNNV